MYDTLQIRRAASLLEEMAQELAGKVKGYYAHIAEDVLSQMKGECAEAIEQCSDDLSVECQSCSGDIERVSALLREYAQRLDEADSQASEMIRSK